MAFVVLALVAFVHAAETADSALARGNAALDAKDYGGARAIFNLVIQMAPENAAAYVGRGRAYGGKNDFEHALADYDEALRLDPKSKEALWNRHYLYSSREEYQKALADIDALIGLEPNEAINFRVRARNKMRLKDYAGALVDAEKSISLKQSDASNLAVRATILARAKSHQEAIADFSQAIRMSKDVADYFFQRAKLYCEVGQIAEAVSDFQQALRLTTDEAWYYNAYAWVLATCPDSQFHDGEKAVRLAQTACELSKWSSSGIVDTLAAAYARAGDFENAAKWQSKAIDLVKTENLQGYRDRLALYQQGKAFVEEPANKDKIAWSLVRSECFETVWSTISDNYYDTTFGGVDWHKVREKYRLRLWALEDKRALRRLLQEMLDELQRTHFAIIPREMAVLAPEERGRIGSSGAVAAVVDDAITIVRVKAGSPAEKAGLRPGDVVRRVDKYQLDEVLATMSESVPSPRKRLLYLRSFVSWWLAAPVGQEVQLQLESEGAALREVKLVTVPHDGAWSEPMGSSPSEPLEQEVCRSGDGVVYLRFSSFALPAMNEFKRVVRDLRTDDCLMIDLRGNGGGLTLMAAGITGRLIDVEYSLGTLRRRYSTESFMAYPQRGAFRGPVAVLVDSASASTSEILAAGLQEIGRARVFGETTAGAALPSLFRKLPTGDMLQYAIADIKTPHGLLLEGNGVTPDEIVNLHRADCTARRDAVREAAEHWLVAQRGAQTGKEAAK